MVTTDFLFTLSFVDEGTANISALAGQLWQLWFFWRGAHPCLPAKPVPDGWSDLAPERVSTWSCQHGKHKKF